MDYQEGCFLPKQTVNAVIKSDLSEVDEVRDLASKALKVFGKVDVLVNNAGIALYDEFEKKAVQGFEQSMQVDLYAPFLLTQLLALDYQTSKTCKGRMAKPEEVAKLVAFLASDDAEFIDGEVIKTDGGYKLM